MNNFDTGHPHPKRILIRSVLINDMCNLKDGTRAATAASKTVVQVSKCVLFFALANEWHNKSTILIYASADCLPRERRIIL